MERLFRLIPSGVRGVVALAVACFALGAGLSVGFQVSLADVFARHDGSGTIHVCVSRFTGAMRYVGTPDRCTASEQLLEWTDGASVDADLLPLITALDDRVTQTEGDIGDLQTDVGDLQTRLTTLEGNFAPVISGVVNGDGTPQFGSGFTVTKGDGVGLYYIDFPAGIFSSYPVPVVTPTSNAGVDLILISPVGDGFRLTIQLSAETPFAFIAMGQAATP